MSFLGNIAAAQSAKAIGRYNNSVYQAQAELAEKRRAQKQQVFNAITRPQVVKSQEREFSNFLVSAMNSGAEFRSGTSPYLVALENKNIQAFNIAVNEFNALTEDQNMQNEAIMLKAAGQGELYKANLTARTQYISAVGSLLGDVGTGYNLYKNYKAG